MKSFFIVFVLLLLSFGSQAQSEQKVKWQFRTVKKGNNVYEIRLVANIDNGWHLYSQRQTADAIALPTAISFSKNPFLSFTGIIKEEGKLFDEIEAATRTRSRYYTNKVEFVQSVKLKKSIKTTVNGEIEFMVCDDRQCLPPSKVKFSVKLQ